jgi:hypothetical protein
MSLTFKSYDEVKWYNYFDPAIDPQWTENYLQEYRDTWPQEREEARPVAKEGEELSCFTLRSLTAGQLNRVERMTGSDKMREICAYGICEWSGLDGENGPVKAKFTKDALGRKLTNESLDFLGFFGFSGVGSTMIDMAAVQIMTLSRSLK